MESLRLARAASGVVWAAIFVVAAFVVQGAIAPVMAPWLPGRLTQTALPLFAATLLVSFILPRPPGPGRFSGIGLGPGRRHWRYLWAGLGIGAGLSGGIVLLQRLLGAVRFERATVEAEWALAGVPATLALSLMIFLAASAGEELLFRGYGFQQLGRALTPEGAAASTAVLFGLMHARNPSVNGLAMLNTALFGLLFGLAMARHRSIWLPFGAHVGWNFTLAVLGAEISGIKIRLVGLAARPLGPDWISGGTYGPEASLLTTVSVGLVLWLMLRVPPLPDDNTLIWDDFEETATTAEGE